MSKVEVPASVAGQDFWWAVLLPNEVYPVMVFGDKAWVTQNGALVIEDAAGGLIQGFAPGEWLTVRWHVGGEGVSK